MPNDVPENQDDDLTEVEIKIEDNKPDVIEIDVPSNTVVVVNFQDDDATEPTPEPVAGRQRRLIGWPDNGFAGTVERETTLPLDTPEDLVVIVRLPRDP